MEGELKYCIDYVKPNCPYRDNGVLNVRHFRTLSEEEASNVLTIIKGCGCKLIALYRGNVQDGKLEEWSPLPMIVNEKEDFYVDGEFDSYSHIVGYISSAFMHYYDNNIPKGNMCLSNMECADIDKAFKEKDWAKIERYIKKLEKAKAYDEAIAKAQKELQSCSSKDCDAARQIYKFFPELAESEDEKIKNAIITTIHLYYGEPLEDEAKEMIAWLEKQGEKAQSEEIKGNEGEISSNWTEEDSLMIDSIIDTIKWLEGKGATNMKIDWLKQLKQRIHVSSAKTCKDDNLLDLLNKMPSCITVDGIDYHFVLKKTIAYMAFYEGEGEGSGKVIFWMAGDPVDLLTEMLEKLKKEGLLE